MFWDAISFSGQGVSNFDTSSVTDMSWMFSGVSSFNRDLSNFDTSSVTNMENMFRYARAFNGDLSNFDTSSVTYMWSMFSGATSFNQDVSSFDLSSVTNMYSMFKGATSFNQDLCSWQDSFPYTNAFDIFTNSNCTYQATPNEDQKGPFCASNCGAPSMSPSSSLAPPATAQPSTPQSPTVSNTGAESSPPQESFVLTTSSMPADDSSSPVASPDSANLSTSEDDEVSVLVLDNDTPAAGKTLEVNRIVTQALNGSCSVSSDLQEVIYIPNPGFTGFDTCVYEACDNVPSCGTATLTVIVVGK